ncbi:UbiD family decarboxylase [Halococcoides cellulosivorans]|uniref:Anhydromevalonate phosphate decarboxylase n=1 Tax=Halococcoides cellulosivorans TaxID=1679096 RepID=A0A2R4WYT2_9EURY|nr:UbiD family decarboxylase [Halococcoides cellulosivorans]AWB26685.1 UbiD family decarboxylase [Halococcoides cellulosivorans]
MGLRSVLDAHPDPTRLTQSVDPDAELPALAVQDAATPTIFESVAGYPDCRVATNCIGTRTAIRRAIDTDESLVAAMSAAMADPAPLERTVPVAAREVATDPDVREHIPIPDYYEAHDRRYLASSVVIAEDPDTGTHNLSFHRMQYLGDNEFAIRLVERHLHDIHSRTEGPTPIAVAMGVHPAVELAAATSIAPGESELELANRLHGGQLATDSLDGLTVPSESEVLMLGEITSETAEEGPFVDLSRTWDRTREQPVVRVNTLMTRPNPLVRIIVPGRAEHANLMGVPQEPRIYRIVENAVPTVANVVLTHGGCSWLHVVVAIDVRTQGDAKNAGLAALAAHPSLKRVTIVDADIDPSDPEAVEWAVATRTQPDRDVEVIEGADGSSLDPSQDFATGTTAKWIVDATRPRGPDREASEFREARIPGEDDIDLEEFE